MANSFGAFLPKIGLPIEFVSSSLLSIYVTRSLKKKGYGSKNLSWCIRLSGLSSADPVGEICIHFNLKLCLENTLV